MQLTAARMQGKPSSAHAEYTMHVGDAENCGVEQASVTYMNESFPHYSGHKPESADFSSIAHNSAIIHPCGIILRATT